MTNPRGDREPYKDGDIEYEGVKIKGLRRGESSKRISGYTSQTAQMLDSKMKQADAAAHSSEGK